MQGDALAPAARPRVRRQRARRHLNADEGRVCEHLNAGDSRVCVRLNADDSRMCEHLNAGDSRGLRRTDSGGRVCVGRAAVVCTGSVRGVSRGL